MDTVDLVVGLAILVGLVGIVVPLLPGSALVGVAVLGWAFSVGTLEAWIYAALAIALLVVGTVVKYAVPGRRLRADGVPTRTLVLGGVLAVVGFFVVPVVGLVLGFVLGVYLAELQRVGSGAAWPSTKSAVKAVGLSLLIELAAALGASAIWLVGAVTT